MNVDAESHVVGQIPADVVGIVVDDDIIAIPVPAIAIRHIEWRHVEIKSVEPEPVRATSAESPNMAGADSAFEATMLPWMVQMEACIAAPFRMTHPFAIFVDVWSVRVSLTIAIGRARRSLTRSVAVVSRRPVLWHKSAAYVLTVGVLYALVSGAMLVVLSP